MTKSEERDVRWDGLSQLLHQMRDSLDAALEEAQRRFASSPDTPLSAPAVEVMVAAVRDRRAGVEDGTIRDMLSDLVFTWDAKVVAEESGFENGWDELSGIVGWQPRMVLDHLMTDVNSTSVDTRSLRWARVPIQWENSADPIVLDVWAGFSEPTSRANRMVGEGTARWDARIDGSSSELLDAIACSTSFDFTDYDDEAIKELLRN